MFTAFYAEHKILIFALTALLAIVGLNFLYASWNATDLTEGLLTYSDDSGLTFQYPEHLPTTYIHEVDWPPMVQFIEGSLTCTEAGNEIEPAGKTEMRQVGGYDYCVTSVSEGAAGSSYIQYAYARQMGNKYVVLSLTTQNVQCANYDEPEKSACESERENFNLDTLVHGIVETM